MSVPKMLASSSLASPRTVQCHSVSHRLTLGQALQTVCKDLKERQGCVQVPRKSHTFIQKGPDHGMQNGLNMVHKILEHHMQSMVRAPLHEELGHPYGSDLSTDA